MDTTAVSWLGLGTLGLIAVWLYFEKKRHPGLEPGKIIMLYMTKYNISFFMMLCIIMNMAEAMMAASLISSDDKFALSFVARYFSHLSLSTMSILGAFTIFKEYQVWRSTFSGWKTFRFSKLVFRSLRLAISAGAAFLLPVLNMYIIGNGLHETAHLKLLLASLNIFDFDHSGYLYLLAKNGLTLEYEPWDNVSYPMIATFGVTITHLITIAWEGLTLTDIDDPVFKAAFHIHDAQQPAPAAGGGNNNGGSNANNNGGGNNNNPPPPGPNAPDPANPYEEAMVELLKFYGLDEQQIKGRLDQARNSLNSQDDATRIAIGSLFAGLEREYKAYETSVANGSLTGQAKTDRENQIITKIASTFAGSIRNKKGLGISLPRSTRQTGN